MKKTSFLVAIALMVASFTAAPLTPSASAQDVFGIDNYTGYNSLLNYSYAKQRARQARSREARGRKSRSRRSRTVRGTRRYQKSRLSKTGRRTNYRTKRRTSYRLRR